MPQLIDRRDFLQCAGAGFLASLSFGTVHAMSKTDAVYASAISESDHSFGVALLNEHGDILHKITLPARGHDVTFDLAGSRAVAFARRPGVFAVSFDPLGHTEPVTFSTPKGRHFFGHGVFSPDGKLLYTTENDFESSDGVIGVYDVDNGFARIGELKSFGVGPHEILLMPDGRNLCVANGGIETHPNYGRAKLNIATMQSSLCFVDRLNGGLIKKQILPERLHKLSIRHMAVDRKGTVIFGCQYQGARTDMPPLVGKAQIGEAIQLWDWPKQDRRLLANYIGSVALSFDQHHAAISSPNGGVAMVLSTKTGEIIKRTKIPRAGGLARNSGGFILTTDRGYFGPLDTISQSPDMPIAFDNHLAVFG